MNLLMKQKFSQKTLMVTMGGEWGRDCYGVLDQHVHYAIFKVKGRADQVS